MLVLDVKIELFWHSKTCLVPITIALVCWARTVAEVAESTNKEIIINISHTLLNPLLGLRISSRSL